MRRLLALIPLGVVVVLIVVCGGSRSGGGSAANVARSPTGTTAATAPAGAAVPSPAGGATGAQSTLGAPAEPTLPDGAVELASGDYGLRRSGDNVQLSLTARGVSCSAQNLLALQTQEETYYFWLYVAPNYDCEQMRRSLLLAAVPESQLNELTAVFGRKTGFQFSKMDPPSTAGNFQVSAAWQDGGSVLFVVFKGWRAPARN